MRRSKTIILLAALPLVALLAKAAGADTLGPETAMRLLQEGKIAPLGRILEAAQRGYPGLILEVELEEEDGELLYEVIVLTEEGLRLEVYYDARTARFVKTETDDGQ